MGSLGKTNGMAAVDQRAWLAVTEDLTDIEDDADDGRQDDSEVFHSHFLNAAAMEMAPSMILPEDEPSIVYSRQRGLKRYYPAMHSILPSRIPDSERDVLPIDRVGVCNTITFSWMTGLLWALFHRGMASMKTYRCTLAESCSLNTQRLDYLWHEELKRHGPRKASLANAVARFLRTRRNICIFLFTLGLLLGFLTPVVFLYKLLQFVKDPDAPLTDGLLYVLVILVIDGIKMFVFSLHWAITIRTSLRIRSALLGLVFNKLVHLNSLGNKSVGEIINLFANDAVRIFEYAALSHLWIGGTIVIVVSLCYIFWILRILALASLAVFVFFYVLMYFMSKLVGYYRKKAVKTSDQRVRQMTEILNCMKIIKLYAWEESFIKTTMEIRNRERSFLEKMVLLQSLAQCFSLAVPIIAAIVTFLTCFLLGHSLNPAQAFSILGALILTRTGLMMLPLTARNIAEFKSSVGRMQSVLLMDDDVMSISKPKDPEHAVKFTKACFAWNAPIECSLMSGIRKKKDTKGNNGTKKNDGTVSPGWTETNPDKQEQERLTTGNGSPVIVPALHDIDLTVMKGQLIGICGTVGSGKSSLISAMLGQMQRMSGDLAVDGTYAYVAQQAWITNDTVKNNVVFGDATVDAKRLRLAIDCCGLAEDIEALPGGLDTEIGERGVNLSGGQKQRVSLARAVYSNRDIYLLDDPLSAVDYRVGTHIFRECIKRTLATKTVLFVSHQIAYLKKCDYVVVMREGRIVEQGIPADLQINSGAYAALLADLDNQQQEASKEHSHARQRGDSYSSGSQIPGTPTSRDGDTVVDKGAAGTRITSDETLEQGSIRCDTYMSYIRAMGGLPVAAIIILAFGVNYMATGSSNWWLSTMLSRQHPVVDTTNLTTNETDTVNGTVANMDPTAEQVVSYDHSDLYIYGGIFVAILLSCVFRAWTYVKGTLHASTVLHNDVLSSVVKSPMRFFETVPVGRTINIFSKDLDEVDTALTTVMEMFLSLAWSNAISLLLVCLVFPWFLIPLVIILALFIFITMIFQVGLRDIKRLENTSRSPLFGHINAMVQGLSTIHAYGKENDFVRHFLRLQDENTALQVLLHFSSRWVAIRLDLLVVGLIVANAMFIVFSRGFIPAAFAGLSLSYSAQLGGMLHFLVRNVAETQARFTNVERIVRHIKQLVPEGSEIVPSLAPPSEWPTDGQIVFDNVKLRYREELPLALQGVSFSIRPMEKVGIIGRTGSGKSSLGVALFRLVELSHGTIAIDGVDISKVELLTLRSRLSMIPQDPVLFIGTVRYNVDPFKQYSDEEIWEALERTRLRDKISSLDKQLYAPVVENGENFSVGERQLMCLARALLRQTKIVLLDEATASVDARTDALVQEILQDAFSKCTILTIAHRVHTVLNYDRILAIKNGKVEKFDSPQNLRANPDSYLSLLLKESLDICQPSTP